MLADEKNGPLERTDHPEKIVLLEKIAPLEMTGEDGMIVMIGAMIGIVVIGNTRIALE